MARARLKRSSERSGRRWTVARHFPSSQRRPGPRRDAYPDGDGATDHDEDGDRDPNQHLDAFGDDYPHLDRVADTDSNRDLDGDSNRFQDCYDILANTDVHDHADRNPLGDSNTDENDVDDRHTNLSDDANGASGDHPQQHPDRHRPATRSLRRPAGAASHSRR